jgi:DNA-binding response OmpR family regulator
MSILSNKRALEGLRILVIEDDCMQADDIVRCLVEAGAVVLGPTGRPDEAHELIEDCWFDAAVLDIDLGAGPTFTLAERLAWLKQPFLFATGYGASTIPPRFVAVPILEKPFSPQALIGSLARIAGN